jgi:hypothetical protein
VTPHAPSLPRGARDRLLRLGPPDPVWMREMRQAQRASRQPWILLALTLTLSLGLCAMGGLAASEDANPAKVGSALFQVFFSISYAVVAIVGPAVAANGVAAEREGRTWEAVLLAGLDAPRLARGKFLAAYTTLSLYIVTLAPVGALSFLFGSVTATELVLAFVLLFAVAALAVWFGLAVSSLMENLRGALVATLALASAVGPALYIFFGLAGGQFAHGLWPEIDRESPIWLPLALARADVDTTYLVGLVLVPAAAFLISARFLHCVTVANLAGETDDRSTGLTRWMLFSTPAVLGVAAAATALTGQHRGDAAIFAMCGALAYAALLTLLFVREPLGPSRRVRVRWAREGASALTRFLGPGLTTSARFVQLATLGLVGALAATGCALVSDQPHAPVDQARVIFLGASGGAFLLFMIGLGHALRARGVAVWTTRALVVGAALAAFIAPWVVAAVACASAGGDKELLALAAPSPFYAFYMFDQVSMTRAPGWHAIGAGLGADVMWALLGVALSAYGAQRAASRRRQAEEAEEEPAGA